MKISNTERTYCFEITVKQMQKILRRDDAARERAYQISMRNSSREGYKRTLDELLKIDNVSEVEYDGMFGPAVWVTIMEPNFEETLEKVKKVIAKYVR